MAYFSCSVPEKKNEMCMTGPSTSLPKFLLETFRMRNRNRNPMLLYGDTTLEVQRVSNRSPSSPFAVVCYSQVMQTEYRQHCRSSPTVTSLNPGPAVVLPFFRVNGGK